MMRLGVGLVAAVVFSLCLTVGLVQARAAVARTPSKRTPSRSALAIDCAYVIALNESSVRGLQAQVWEHLGVPAQVALAVNASGARQYAEDHPEDVPLYVRHTMRFGRHHHMQIGNPEMLGCLLSHMAVWARFLASPHRTVAVFEEDARLDAHSAEVLWELEQDLIHARLPSWSILMLESGQINSGHPYEPLGRQLRRCAASDDCSWYGTRGYVLTRGGAEALLRHAHPVTVQVDSLVYLTGRLEPGFVMLWTGTSVAKSRTIIHLVISTVFDGCIKCFMPVSPLAYVVALGLMVCVYGLAWEWAAMRAAHLVKCDSKRAQDRPGPAMHAQ
jgi:GR25 family glycosyltransferase involved in LPS biosynthesis